MNYMKAPIIKYVLLFAAIYAAIMIFINILVHGFNIDISSGANLAMLMGAGYGTAVKFVQDTKRPPSKKEKRLLSFGCLISAFLISITGMAIIVPFVLGGNGIDEIEHLLNEISLTVWLLILLFISLLYYAALNILFGWAAQKYAAKAIPQNKI